MSLESVRRFLSQHAPEIEILITQESSATVLEAAKTHNVEPARIAKTLSFSIKGETILIVMSEDARLNNKKFKTQFATKAKMLNADNVMDI